MGPVMLEKMVAGDEEDQGQDGEGDNVEKIFVEHVTFDGKRGGQNEAECAAFRTD